MSNDRGIKQLSPLEQLLRSAIENYPTTGYPKRLDSSALDRPSDVRNPRNSVTHLVEMFVIYGNIHELEDTRLGDVANH